MQKQKIHNKIKSYARKCVKYGRTNIDKLSKIQRECEDFEIEKLKERNLPYYYECLEKDVIINEVQNIFDFYFALYDYRGCRGGWDWINGNDNFKKLIEEIKQTNKIKC